MDETQSRLRNRDKSKSSISSSNGTSSSKKMPRVGPAASRRKLWIILVLLLIGVIWVGFNTSPSGPSHKVGWWDENIAVRFGFSKETYAVVLDAGSTGTRVLAFAFYQNLKGIIG